MNIPKPVFCRVVRMACCVLSAALSVSVCADEIAFTGGSSGTSVDLSLADNWAGGVLPSSAGTTGVVDVATFGTSYSVSSDVAMNGIEFVNVSAMTTLEGEGELSLGAGGFTVVGTGGVALKAPISVSAASTWSFGGGAVNVYAKISGSSDLAVESWSALHLREAPCYGGEMTVTGSGLRSPIYVYQADAWANTVKVKAGSIVYMFSGTVAFSTMFPGRSLTHTSWAAVTMAGGGTLVFEDGDTFVTSGDYSQIADGALEVTGGSYTSGAAFLMAGMSGTESSAQTAPSSFTLSGGDFSVNQFLLGIRAATNRLVRQTGGSATACSYHIGGGDAFKGTVPVMEYRLEGGTIADKSGGNQDRGLVFGGYATSANATACPGVFTMTGGVADFTHVRFGAKGGMWTWDGASSTPNGSAYGLLDLRGGEFRLPTESFTLAPMWNYGSVSNSAYDVRLSGGTVKAKGTTVSSLAMTVTAGDGASTIDTGAYDVLVAAPLDGDGTLRKSGSGRLQLSDATRFKGSVQVDEGVLEVRGSVAAPEGYTVGENLLVFAADSLSSLADGDDVSSWSDSTATLSCQMPTSDEISSVGTYKLPTFKSNVANGHAGVCFNKENVLCFHPDDNPLAGETNFSFAVVFRPTSSGTDASASNYYAGNCIIGNDRSWSGKGPNGISLLYNNRSCVPLYIRNNAPNAGGIGRSYMVPTLSQGYGDSEDYVSVAIVSMSGNKVVYNFNNCFTNRVFETIAENFNPRFMNGSTKYPLYLGTSDVDGSQKEAARCFGGYIHEVRFYKGRALTEAETRSVMDELTRKYVAGTRADDMLMASSGPCVADLADSRTEPTAKDAEVEWTPEFMIGTYDTWGSGYNKPELVSNACNGCSALRFDASRQTVLKIPDGDNKDPISGCSQFGIAIVFRTTEEGSGLADGSVGTGLYSSMLAGYGHDSGCANASITFRECGAVGGYMATNYGGGSLLNSRKPCRLNDGLPHVAVFSADSQQGAAKFRLMVDGVFTENTLGYGTAWPGYDSSRPHVIGALRAGVGHFTGDIMCIAFWKTLLTEDEMLAICRKAAYDYGFNLKERRAYSMDSVEALGVSATNYTVAAGAVLRMPLSSTSPFAPGKGAVFSGDGTFEGSYRFAGGAAADFGGTAARMEDVQLASGGVMRFGPGAVLPVSGENVSSISGDVVVDVTGSPAESFAEARKALLLLPEDRIAEGASFELAGGSRNMWVEYDDNAGGLVVVQKVGMIMVVR